MSELDLDNRDRDQKAITMDSRVNAFEEQQAIRARCFHPSGSFAEFTLDAVERSIPHRFEEMVRQFPDRLAVGTGSESLSYAKLNELGNRVAHTLLERRGQKAQLVAILLEKDAPQLAAMLGVVKAGMFFLILDPSFPKARLGRMLEDSRAKLILTNRDYRFLASELAKPDCQLIDWQDISPAVSCQNPGVVIPPQALAFINYTSGSTGEPKGLLRTHRMILHNIMLRTNLIHVCEQDRISLLSSGTSNAITNTFLALLNGAALFSLELKKEGVMRLVTWLMEERITICPMSSPLFRSLCGTLSGKDNFPDLRVIRLRSEAVYKTDTDLYKTYFSPGCIFVTGLSSNETGPLRDFLIDHRTGVSGAAVPVGYPVHGKEILLLDDSGKEVGLNEVGEIAVRSRYLSPGYLRRPQLTKAKFKPDREQGGGGRFYLTGDLGVMLPDGCLVYKGRKDFRIKIRGYAVDLKEVELALRDHPDVADAVVLARENELREKELVAYLVPSSRIMPNTSELRSFLGQRLADYMIPSVFVTLDRIPLTPHNKVDRSALPAPGKTRAGIETPLSPPQNQLEHELLRIWSEVLHRDEVGRDDNFFDLGGHSLAAGRIISRVIQTYGLQVPIEIFFNSPTVAEMAAAVVEQLKSKSEPARRNPENAIENRVSPTNEFIEFKREELEQSICNRFEKIVRQFPDRVAIKVGEYSATYAQLNRMADRHGRTLLTHGNRSLPVALLFGKGIGQITAMLGVLKAGRFFVVLDPSLPGERIKDILEDSQAGVLLSDGRHFALGQKVAGSDCRLVVVESLDDSPPAEDLQANVGPDTLAAIVYTSGSTGQPKGVMQTHRSLLHRVMLYTNAYHLCAQDRISLLTFGTSSAITNTLCALLNGATLSLFDVKREGIASLGDWLVQGKVSICWIGAPLFRGLCETLTGSERFPNLRLIGVRSETVHKTDFDLYKKYFQRGCLFSSSLSSTESGTLAIFFADHDTEIAGSEVPAGYPAADKDLLLRDDDGNELGFNQVGEIVVRSRYLSPGYWRGPDLTEARFKKDLEISDNSLYSTGDLGLRLRDGRLLHKGRKDFRVKIRGYGVEIAEVEKVLRSHASVRDAAVLAHADHSGETALFAYFTSSSRPGPSASELRTFMNQRLPEPMIPSAFVLLDAIPLTANGKVDRGALPPPGRSRPLVAARYVAPASPQETTLAKIWAEVLGLEDVGVRDNFFDLGGHSLLAMRVLSRIRDHFRMELPLAQFFEMPTIAASADYIEKSLLARGGTKELPATAGVTSAEIPLSFAQERLWFLDQLEPGSCKYNLFSAYQLKGELNAAALEQSLNEIIRRHEALRTTFTTVNGRPIQRILPFMSIKLPVVDLSGIVSDTEGASELRRICTAEAQRPFDLEGGPLLRANAIRLADDEHILVLTLHHIVFDAWSRGKLAKELSVLYEGFSSGRASSLPALSLQYKEFAQWQRKWLQGEVLEAQLAYWTKQLEGLSTLQLPVDQPGSAVQGGRGARQYLALSESLSAGLKRLSHSQGATLFMTLLAAYQTLLHRYTGQIDIVVGSPIAGRNRSEFENLIGFFLNMLVLRTDLSGNPTFSELLARVRETCLGAYAHQDLPFEKLVEKLQPQRDLSQHPLFQVTFAFQNAPTFPLSLAGLTARNLELDSGIARFDLHLFLEEEKSRLRGYINYNTDLFSAEIIGRMIGHFEVLLEGIVANPDEPIRNLPLLMTRERSELLFDWNDTRKDYPQDRCIHDLFDEQVERTPDAVAVVFGRDRLTYRELKRRADRLAQYLRRLGVGAEVPVAVCIERSLEMVVGILGILKAGGAYVPLDPAYPKERLAFMLEDTRAAVLLTQRSLLDKLTPHEAKTVCLDTDWEIIRAAEGNNQPPHLISKNLAYVIYTSGSTGTPKGIAITHSSAVSLLSWAQTAFSSEDVSGVLASTSICFDLSIFELFVPLSMGGKVILANDLLQLPDLPHANEVTLVNTVPSAMAELLRLGGIPASVHTVNLAGEPLRLALVRQIFEQLRINRVFDLYGPSEDTTYSTSALRTANGRESIGRPIANTQVYLVDAYLQPVPVGIPGELCIAGEGLARGYLNRPELTAERFIPHPFSEDPGARLYKTGDLARYLADGTIEFLGRLDFQVKLRGFRVEPGEIETLLGRHPAVRQAVVTLHEDKPSEPFATLKRLVAYVVPMQTQAPDTTQLRSFLSNRLPSYMVPSAFVFLDRLPFTPNGKVDRKALPPPDTSTRDSKKPFTPPCTAMEKTVAEIWFQVLHVERIGVHDDFFELGGHSLLATQVVWRVRNALKIDLPLRALFEHPTVASLAVRVEEAQGACAAEMEDLLTDLESLTDKEAVELLRSVS
jgi:amino acid adenylation domain-containing protein